MKNIFPVIVLGCTGSGKSKLAIEIATRLGGEIISTDSMQVYKGLDIITNKVSEKEKKICPHHMIDFLNPITQDYNVVNFRDEALKIIDRIMMQRKLPIIVGGTNYYIEALLWNMLLDSQILTQTSEGKSDKDPFVKRQDGFASSQCNQITAKPTDGKTCYSKHTTKELHEKLTLVDKERAQTIHPNDRRKILRSLEVYDQYKVPMSRLLDEQHAAEGGGTLSGPLRYPHPCIIWITCEQEVLDRRTDDRVEQMLKDGLVEEMVDFHEKYNSYRISQNIEADYTKGIFQSIGFKEFHPYLILSNEERATEKGEALLKEGVEEMKRVTRQYARKQVKWIVNRFLKRKGKNVPAVYAVDATDPSVWEDKVLRPALSIADAFLKGEKPNLDPVKMEEPGNTKEYNVCDICDGLVFITSKDWQAHIKGRRHKKSLQHLHSQRKRKQWLEDEHQAKTAKTHAPGSDNDTVHTGEAISSELYDNSNGQ